MGIKARVQRLRKGQVDEDRQLLQRRQTIDTKKEIEYWVEM